MDCCELLPPVKKHIERQSSVMATAKAFGARRIIAIDVNAGRLDFAKQYLDIETHIASAMEQGEDRATYSQRHVCPNRTVVTGCRPSNH